MNRRQATTIGGVMAAVIGLSVLTTYLAQPEPPQFDPEPTTVITAPPRTAELRKTNREDQYAAQHERPSR